MITRNSGILGWSHRCYTCVISLPFNILCCLKVFNACRTISGHVHLPELGASCNIGPKSLTAWTMVSHHVFTQWSHAISIFQEVISWQVRRSESHKAWNFTHMLRALNSLIQWLPHAHSGCTKLGMNVQDPFGRVIPNQLQVSMSLTRLYQASALLSHRSASQRWSKFWHGCLLQASSRSFKPLSMKAVSVSQEPPPAKWPQMPGITRSSASGMWLTSYSSSATGKYRSISAGITIAFACM